MLYTVTGVVLYPDGESVPVIKEYWASNRDDARTYFEMECKADNIEMYQIHEVDDNPDEKLFHEYQTKEFGDSWDIVKDCYNPDKCVTETILVGQNYNDHGMAIFDCYALINGLISEPLPVDEQYIVNTKG